MEYAPPTFSFTGLQFNPDIFENPIVDNIVPDPLPIGELNTNNIQALNDANPVTLYTSLANILTLGVSTITNMYIYATTLTLPNSIVSTTIANTLNLFTTHTGTINYGNSAIVQSYIKAKSVLFGNFSIGTSIAFFMSSLTSVTCSFYGDNANPTVTTANIQATRSATTPLVTNSGDLTISCGNMNLIANQVYSQSPISVNEIQCYSNSNIDYMLWFNSTATDELYIGSYDIANTSNVNVGAGNQIINIGQNSGRTASINIGSATSSSNVIVMGGTNTLVTIGGVAQITLGVAGGTLQTPRTFTTSAPANALQLWTAQTGNINIGSTGQIRLPNTIVSGSTSTAVSLYGTQTSDITIGGTGILTCNSNNFIMKGTGLSVNVSKKTNPIVPAIQELYYADDTRPTNASVTVQVTDNNTATANDGDYEIFSRTHTLASPSNNATLVTTVANTNIGQQFYTDATALTTISASIAASPTTGSLVNNDGFLTLSARNVILGCPLLPQYNAGYSATTGTTTADTIGYTRIEPFTGTVANLAINTGYVTAQMSISKNGIYLFELTQGFTVSVAGSTNRHITSLLVRNNANVTQATLGSQTVNGTMSTTNYYQTTSAIYIFNSISFSFPWNVQAKFETGNFTGTMALISTDYRFTATRIA